MTSRRKTSSNRRIQRDQQRRVAGLSVLLAFGSLLATVAAVAAQTSANLVPATEPASSEPARQGPTDRSELEPFVDGWMAAYMDTENVAGGTVSVVRDGTVLLAKGYGYADIESRTRVSPETTLFRIGSVTKLFTWISVMQQVEAGRLDLEADVNDYLTDLEVPSAADGPVTLKHLMTHTPGFEDQVLGLFGRDQESLRPLGEILREQMPARVRAAGDLASYSNHGTGLAMHLVEQVTGENWLEYIDRHILGPLGASHLSMAQPLPPELVADLSQGYHFGDGEYQPRDFEYVPLAPVGAASASAGAMARFMLMLLGGCHLDGVRILQAETCTRMLTDLHRMAEGVNSMAYGFMDMSSHGQRAVGHGGDTLWFHTWLTVFPQHDLGLFVSFNTDTGNPGRFYQAFLDRYFPLNDSKARPPGGNRDDLERFTGAFRANRFSHRSLAKVAALVGALVISVDQDGYLVTPGSPKQRWAPAGPLRFVEVDGDRELVFREDDQGRITHVLRSDLPILAFERPPASERPKLHLLFGLTALAGLAITFAFWPIAAAVRFRYGIDRLESTRVPRTARRILWLAAVCLLVYMVGLAAILSDPNEIVFGIPTAFKLLQWLPIAAAVLGIAAVIGAVRMWLTRRGWLLSRLSYSVALVCLLVLLWQLNVWNLFGFRY